MNSFCKTRRMFCKIGIALSGQNPQKTRVADVAELVDARDLKSRDRAVFLTFPLQPTVEKMVETRGTKRDLQNNFERILPRSSS